MMHFQYKLGSNNIWRLYSAINDVNEFRDYRALLIEAGEIEVEEREINNGKI